MMPFSEIPWWAHLLLWSLLVCLGWILPTPGSLPPLKGIRPAAMAPKVGSIPMPDEKVYLRAALDSCKYDFRTLSAAMDTMTAKHQREMRRRSAETGEELARATAKLRNMRESHKQQMKAAHGDVRLSSAIFDMEVNLKNAAIEDLRQYRESVHTKLQGAKTVRDRYLDLSRRAETEIERRVAEALRNLEVRPAHEEAAVLTSVSDKAEIERLQRLVKELEGRLGACRCQRTAIQSVTIPDERKVRPKTPRAAHPQPVPTPLQQTYAPAVPTYTAQQVASATPLPDSPKVVQLHNPSPTTPVYTVQQQVASTTAPLDPSAAEQAYIPTPAAFEHTEPPVVPTSALSDSPEVERPQAHIVAAPNRTEPPEAPAWTPESFQPQLQHTFPAAHDNTDQRIGQMAEIVDDDSRLTTTQAQNAVQLKQDEFDDEMNVDEEDTVENDKMDVAESPPRPATVTTRPSSNNQPPSVYAQQRNHQAQEVQQQSIYISQSSHQPQQPIASTDNDRQMEEHRIAEDPNDQDMEGLEDDFEIYGQETDHIMEDFEEISQEGLDAPENPQFGHQPVPTESSDHLLEGNTGNQQDPKPIGEAIEEVIVHGQVQQELPSSTQVPTTQPSLSVQDTGTEQSRNEPPGGIYGTFDEESSQREDARQEVPYTSQEDQFDDYGVCTFCGRNQGQHEESCLLSEDFTFDADAACAVCGCLLSGIHEVSCLFFLAPVDLPKTPQDPAASPGTRGEEEEDDDDDDDDDFEDVNCDRCYGTIKNHMPTCPTLARHDSEPADFPSECPDCHQPNPQDSNSHEAWCTWLMITTPPETSPIEHSPGQGERQTYPEYVPEERSPEFPGKCPICGQGEPGTRSNHDDWCTFLPSPTASERRERYRDCELCGGLNGSHIGACLYDRPRSESPASPANRYTRSEEEYDRSPDPSPPNQYTSPFRRRNEDDEYDRDRSPTPPGYYDDDPASTGSGGDGNSAFRPSPPPDHTSDNDEATSADEMGGLSSFPPFPENATGEELETSQQSDDGELVFVNDHVPYPPNVCATCSRPEMYHKYSPCRAVCSWCKEYYSLHSADGSGCLGDGLDKDPEGEDEPLNLGPVAEKDCLNLNCKAKEGYCHSVECPIAKEKVREAQIGAEQRRLAGKQKLKDEMEAARMENEREEAEREVRIAKRIADKAARAAAKRRG